MTNKVSDLQIEVRVLSLEKAELHRQMILTEIRNEENRRQLVEEHERLTLQLSLAEEKAKAYDAFLSSEGLQSIEVVAKALGTGGKRLMRHLREAKFLTKKGVPYQRFVNRGYFVVRMKTIWTREGKRNVPVVLVTPRGFDAIYQTLTVEGALHTLSLYDWDFELALSLNSEFMEGHI